MHNKWLSYCLKNYCSPYLEQVTITLFAWKQSYFHDLFIYKRVNNTSGSRSNTLCSEEVVTSMFMNKQELEEMGIDTFQNEAQREKLV